MKQLLENPNSLLVCPKDHLQLVCRDDKLTCDKCCSIFIVENKIPIFCSDGEWEVQYASKSTYYAKKGLSSLKNDVSYLHLRDDDYFGIVMDLGSGDGVYASAAPSETPVYCVDVTPTGLRRIFNRGMNNLIPIAASGYELPFDDETFDTILFVFVVEHLARNNCLCMLREIKRVLKSGCGRIIYVTDTPFFDRWLVRWTSYFLRGKHVRQDHTSSTGHVNLMNMQESKKLVREAGLRIVSEHCFWMGERFLIWNCISRILRCFLTKNKAVNYLTSKYALVLKK